MGKVPPQYFESKKPLLVLEGAFLIFLIFKVLWVDQNMCQTHKIILVEVKTLSITHITSGVETL